MATVLVVTADDAMVDRLASQFGLSEHRVERRADPEAGQQALAVCRPQVVVFDLRFGVDAALVMTDQARAHGALVIAIRPKSGLARRCGGNVHPVHTTLQ